MLDCEDQKFVCIPLHRAARGSEERLRLFSMKPLKLNAIRGVGRKKTRPKFLDLYYVISIAYTSIVCYGMCGVL